MRIYHKIQMTFFQKFDQVNVKENSKNGYGIMCDCRRMNARVSHNMMAEYIKPLCIKKWQCRITLLAKVQLLC